MFPLKTARAELVCVCAWALACVMVQGFVPLPSRTARHAGAGNTLQHQPELPTRINYYFYLHDLPSSSTLMLMAIKAIEPIPVTIERPTFNSRRISANIVVDRPIQDVWRILTDYNNLATHVPNLVQSYLIPVQDDPKIIRLFQEGSQNIIGFDFRASLTMDMTEVFEDPFNPLKERKVLFKLHDSKMFSEFDGEWAIKHHSRTRVPLPPSFNPPQMTNCFTYRYRSLVSYRVTVKPKGPVPVLPLEWRIREDVPVNLLAVKRATESLPMADIVAQCELSDTGAIAETTIRAKRWDTDETLAMYLNMDAEEDLNGEDSR